MLNGLRILSLLSWRNLDSYLMDYDLRGEADSGLLDSVGYYTKSMVQDWRSEEGRQYP